MSSKLAGLCGPQDPKLRVTRPAAQCVLRVRRCEDTYSLTSPRGSHGGDVGTDRVGNSAVCP
jgi:hypothetical protein